VDKPPPRLRKRAAGSAPPAAAAFCRSGYRPGLIASPVGPPVGKVARRFLAPRYSPFARRRAAFGRIVGPTPGSTIGPARLALDAALLAAFIVRRRGGGKPLLPVLTLLARLKMPGIADARRALLPGMTRHFFARQSGLRRRLLPIRRGGRLYV
jgi:hypothetical protein